MNCPLLRLDAWLDEELDAAQMAEIETHLAGCADCAAAAARMREQKRRIRAEAPYYPAPAELQHSIRQALRHESAADAPWRWMAIAACLLLAASLSWNALLLRSRMPAQDVAAGVLTGHFRSLLAGHLLDVESTDQHTVKPWFAGKLDFSPEVKDLAAEGFPLIGGRVDYLSGHRVAALIFHRRQHVINLFTWPEEAPAGETRLTRGGVHLLHWTENGMTYWAVSDVAAAELDRLRELYRSSSQ